MRNIFKIMAVMAFVLTPVMSAAKSGQDVDYHYVDRPFLELLGFLEGPDGYNDITGFTDREPVKPVIWMTINEVLDFQRMLRQQGEESSAMGRYQFIYKTLLYMTDVHNINREDLFDKKMQDHLARLEMSRCGFYDRHRPVAEVGDCLSAVWAALPRLSGHKRGQSRYKSTGINSARTSPLVFEAVLRARVIEYKPQTWTPDMAKKPKANKSILKAGFSDSTDIYKGYGAPLRAIPVEALTVEPSDKAPSSSIRPVSRKILTLKNGRPVKY